MAGKELNTNGCRGEWGTRRGAPAPALFANGLPASPNPAYSLQAQVVASNYVIFAFASQTANVPLGNGCTLLVDDTQMIATHLVQANGSGAATWNLPVPAGLAATDVACQAFELVVGGPIVNLLAASNGLRIRAAGTGCP